MNLNSKIYSNTAKADVLNFVQKLEPTQMESLYLSKIFTKHGLSMRDMKVIIEYLTRRGRLSLPDGQIDHFPLGIVARQSR